MNEQSSGPPLNLLTRKNSFYVICAFSEEVNQISNAKQAFPSQVAVFEQNRNQR